MRNGPSQPELLFYCLSRLFRIFLSLVVCFPVPRLQSQMFPGTTLPQRSAPAPAEKQAPQSPSSPPAKSAIPLPQIADQADELEQQLREISNNLKPLAELQVSDREVKIHTEQFDERAVHTEELLGGKPNLKQLQDEERYWRAFAKPYGNRRKLLTARAADIEEDMSRLNTEQKRWQATWDEVQSQSGPEIVAHRVRRALDEIHQLRTEAQQQLNLLLVFQNRISEQDREISVLLRKLDEAYDKLRGKLFEQDGPPLWAASELHISDKPINTIIYASAWREFLEGWYFVRGNIPLITGIAMAYFLALLIAFRLKNYLASKDRRDRIEGSHIFRRPFSIALLVTFFTTIGISFSAPTSILLLVSLLYLVPVLRLLPLLVGPGMRKIIYRLCIFYVLEWTYLGLQSGASFQRGIFALIILLALTIFAWLARTSRLKIQPASAWGHKLLFAGRSIGLLLLATSLLANIFGFFSLSQVLGIGALFSAFSLVLLYTMVRVLHLCVVILVRSAWFQSLPDARDDTVERWVHRILIAGATVLWLNIDLYLFTVRGGIKSVLQGVLQYQIGFGKIHVTLGGTLSLVLLIFFGYMIANIASFFLGSILLPHLSLKGGMSYAISRVTYYVLLVGLFFAASTSAGLELNKFTLITGALGVGVGFGLQNIVNNFASGLIVLFERPIRVSDTVEVAGVVGTVRRIGARSSTVLTAQGAEVIFPNSTLVSNPVINWTLSSPRRRVEIPVGVSYSANPDVVLKLLTEVATANPRVLSYPPPETSFLGFGENALNFQLAFWAAQSAWFELKSEIGLAVFRSLHDAGIEIPFPQRDLHLRNLDSAVKQELSAASDNIATRKTEAA